MSNSKESSGELVKAKLELVDDNSIVAPEFIQELRPSAERTALLYHLAFLSLGSFPNLERMIRKQAIETQMLFGSSEAVLIKCVGTSSNLVTSLFPILKRAVEMNKPKLANSYLIKAGEWIQDIVTKVDDIVKRYEVHNESVSTCTSNVYQEQDDTKEKIHKKSDEMKGLEDALVKFKQELEKQVNKLEANENQIQETNEELNDFIRRFKKEHDHWTKKFVDFFKGCPDAMKEPDAIALDRKLKDLNSEKCVLRNEGWNIKIQQTDLQLKLANCKIRMGEIPDPVHLTEVQECLTRIQNILVELKKFWEKVNAVLSSMKEQTSVGDKIDTEDMEDMKDLFLSSIEDAEKYWVKFGMCCQEAYGVFRVQSRDAYKFLEINPSSLSEEEKKRQYESIMENLEKIDHEQRSPRAAITVTSQI